MKLWCLTDNSFICFGGNTEALRHSYPINSGQFSQVRAFPSHNHEFCFVNILKTKDKGTHVFLSFHRIDCSLTAIVSLRLSSSVRCHTWCEECAAAGHAPYPEPNGLLGGEPSDKERLFPPGHGRRPCPIPRAKRVAGAGNPPDKERLFPPGHGRRPC